MTRDSADHPQPAVRVGAAFGYTVATGRLFLPMDEFHRRAEALLGRPILTHEFADQRTWTLLREAFEAAAFEAFS